MSHHNALYGSDQNDPPLVGDENQFWAKITKPPPAEITKPQPSYGFYEGY